MLELIKRRQNPGLNRQYLALVQELTEEEDVLSIEPVISPVRVIERCQATISYPFTSTAVYARQQGKPSIYYDPIGVIQEDDRAAHGIEVISGIGELRKWVATFLAEEKSELLQHSTR